MDMLTKSIRLNKQDGIGLADIIANDPRVERGPSEALRICFEDAATFIPTWKDVKELARKLEYPENLVLEGNDTKTFVVSEEVYCRVYNSICEQLGCTRPRASFITRLCIYNTRLKLRDEQLQEKEKLHLESLDNIHDAGSGNTEKNTTINITNIEAVELLKEVNQKAANLIIRGDYRKVLDFLKED